MPVFLKLDGVEGESRAHDGEDLLIVNNGDGSDFGPAATADTLVFETGAEPAASTPKLQEACATGTFYPSEELSLNYIEVEWTYEPLDARDDAGIGDPTTATDDVFIDGNIITAENF